jgi:NadR type nicotinamide-nucleotide adenylyltransferase
MNNLRRIAIIGPESTGKSELSQQLAAEFETEWVPEFARFYLDRLDRPYEKADLLEIAKGQLDWEDDKAGYAQTYLFCDTNLIVIKIWSDHKFQHTDAWIEEQLSKRTYDFYLLNDIDLPWTPDPQREHPTKRKYFMGIYKNYLEEHELPYAIVSGIEEERKMCALKALQSFF